VAESGPTPQRTWQTLPASPSSPRQRPSSAAPDEDYGLAGPGWETGPGAFVGGWQGALALAPWLWRSSPVAVQRGQSSAQLNLELLRSRNSLLLRWTSRDIPAVQ
jgi:hypothetical protein